MLYERKLEELNQQELSKKNKKFLENLKNCQKKKIFVNWRNVYKGLMIKQKIFELQIHFSQQKEPKELEIFWENILKELEFFDDFLFAKKMNAGCDSLLDLFFISFFKRPHNLKGFLRLVPVDYDTTKMIQIFQKLVDKTNLKIDRFSNRGKSSFYYLIHLNDFEFFEYVFSTFKISNSFPFHEFVQMDPKIYFLGIEKFGEANLTETYFLQIFFESHLEVFNHITKNFHHPEYLKKIDFLMKDLKGFLPRIEFCIQHTKGCKGLTTEQIIYLFKNSKEKLELIPIFMKYKNQFCEKLIENIFQYSLENVNEMKYFVENGFDVSKSNFPYFYYMLENVNFLQFDEGRGYDCIDFLLDHGYDINTNTIYLKNGVQFSTYNDFEMEGFSIRRKKMNQHLKKFNLEI
jgi:hypothetical protein